MPCLTVPLHRLALLTGIPLLLLAGCFLRRTYDVQGRVMGFGDDGHTVIIQHEEVPGLMPAMTMSFKVRDRALLEELALQDAVRFRLVLSGPNCVLINEADGRRWRLTHAAILREVLPEPVIPLPA